VGFVYKDKDSGKIFVHVLIEQVIAMARQHRSANNYPIPMDFNQVVIDSICANGPKGLCFDEPPPSAGQKAISAARALYESALSGFATLSAEEVAQRQAVCETSGIAGAPCEYYKGMKGIFSVMCGKCGCTKLKIHLKTSQCPKNLWPI
jgi:hypothetical protein